MNSTHWDHVSAQVELGNLNQLLLNWESERESCLADKQALELKLSELQSWKRAELSRILSKGLPPTRAIAATADLEVRLREQKDPLLKAKNKVETRLREVKSELAKLKQIEGQHAKPEENKNDVLLRIEKLLIKLVNKLGA